MGLTNCRHTSRTAFYRALTAMLGDEQDRVSVPVLTGPAHGIKLQLDLIRRQEGAYLWGRYERPILQRLQSLVQPGWTVWDCGTYLGLYTVFFSRLVGSNGKVVAIEPDERNL